MICSYGCNQEAKYQLKCGKWCCSEHQNKCPEIKRKNSESVKKSCVGKEPWYKRKNVAAPMLGKKSWNKGLTKENNSIVLKNSQSLKEYYKTHDSVFKGKHHTEEARNKIREKIIERYKNGWRVRCGMCRKIKYYSSIAGLITVDGNWELAVSKYLDQIKVKWKRNTKRFEYLNLNGKISTYCPDFYIEDWNTYLEIKGYQTKLDDCKWSQFKEPLIIWKYEKLLEMNIINKNGNCII